jgi:rhamnose utilization protein RhaD (predicted bifunctional aldolase and dehydrogenase)
MKLYLKVGVNYFSYITDIFNNGGGNQSILSKTTDLMQVRVRVMMVNATFNDISGISRI